MPSAPIPANEAERLAALRSYGVLEGTHEESLDAICRVVSSIFACPIALVSLSDVNRQVFKGRVGLAADELARELAPCAHAILGDSPLVVEDLTRDARFADNPLVVGEPNARFYVGMPLLTPDRFALGTLCAIDSQTHRPTRESLENLVDLAATVMTMLNMRKAMTRARTFALTDVLTGLANRAGLLLELESILEAGRSDRAPFAVLFLDVDNFKGVNDSQGHAGGDDVLCRIGHALERSVRLADTAGRIGGDEFAVLIPQCDAAAANALARRIMHNLNAVVTGRRVPVGFSIGLACFTTPPASAGDAMGAADRLMYIAKRSGKNRIVSSETTRVPAAAAV